MAFGFVLMVIGMLVYIGTFMFALMSTDFDELRMATILSFMGMVTFMLGSVMEIAKLRKPSEEQEKVGDSDIVVTEDFVEDERPSDNTLANLLLLVGFLVILFAVILFFMAS